MADLEEWEQLIREARNAGAAIGRISVAEYAELRELDAKATIPASYLPPLPLAEGQPEPVLLRMPLVID